jgi:hypothetical protein
LCCWNKGLRTVTQRRWNQVYFAPLTRGTFQASQGSQYPLENVRDPGSSPPLLLPASQSHLCDQTMVMAHLCAMKERSMKATCPASPGQTPKRHTSLPLTLRWGMSRGHSRLPEGLGSVTCGWMATIPVTAHSLWRKGR